MASVVGVVNQKGGVGKTTTTVNVAASLCAAELSVLVVDCDPQGNATTGLGGNKHKASSHLYDLLMNDADIDQCVTKISDTLSLIESTPHLSGVEIEFAQVDGWAHTLKERLAEIKDNYDVVLIDSPPSLGMLTVNILVSSDYILVPLQCEFYALEGLSQLWKTLSMTQKGLNPHLDVLAIVLTMFEDNSDLNNQVADDVRSHFKELVCQTVIPRDARMSESPSFSKPVLWYGSDSKGSLAYIKLAHELIERLKLPIHV
uniref:Chromosome partitioning protein ParA n=1 Tax=Magnetococcus massalia (strain MO-1) TaxID=451514 RepID=A0A1S7LN62_MAGMO|nr:Chromosome partitioning protein ParA [Candidatus Magnetococcus massalia]